MKLKCLQIKDHSILEKEIMIMSYGIIMNSATQMCLLVVTISQVSDVAHGPLVYT